MALSFKPRTYIITLIKVYQVIASPFMPSSCRFMPTCSAYASLAINRYGIIKGGFLALIRILKCHPFHPGGYDPLK
ncbi:MAG: membrane protein insertion efficiency factor YidD [Deltaproteobacteria bacterium]|nr:MAG: membrane protein insertion efficiency factor YidD [Deltaproteobacteria bacterium]